MKKLNFKKKLKLKNQYSFIPREIKIFFSAGSTSVVVIILYSEANFLYKRLLVSSVKAIVGTIIKTFFCRGNGYCPRTNKYDLFDIIDVQ